MMTTFDKYIQKLAKCAAFRVVKVCRILEKCCQKKQVLGNFVWSLGTTLRVRQHSGKECFIHRCGESLGIGFPPVLSRGPHLNFEALQ